MKTNNLKGIICLVVAIAAVSCTDGIGTGFDIQSGTGKIALTTDVDASVKSSRSSRAEYSEITPDDLTLKLTSADGSISKTYGSVADFDANYAFNVGVYTMEAYYGDKDTEGFESPYFYGSTQVKVEENKTTPVHLTASLGNAMVSVEYTESFIGYMSSWSAEVHTPGGEYMTYAQDETRPVYVKEGRVEISVDFTKPNGNGAKMSVAEFDAAAARHYHVKVDMTGGSGAAEQIVVTLDEELQNESSTIDIGDEILNAPAPKVTPVGFVAGEAFDFVAGLPYEESLNFSIIAGGGLKEVKLTTNSASLIAQGWPAEIELMRASAAERQTLGNLGLDIRGLYDNPDKLAVISFADVFAHIAYLPAGDNTSVFTVEVKDKYSKVSAPVSLNVVAKVLSLSLENAELYVMGTQLTVDVRFNGGDPTGKVTMKYFNEGQGVYRPLNPTFTKISNGLYRAVATVQASSADLKITASAPGGNDVELNVVRRVQVAPAPGTVPNAFAKFAYVPVTIGSQDNDLSFLAEMLAAATVYVSTDGTNFTAATTEADAVNHLLKISGLTPGTAYTAKIRNGSQELDGAPTFTFETEAATPIANGDMEDWASTNKTNLTANCDVWSLGGAWATLNDLTTSKLASGSNYSAISSTAQDLNGHNGKAALIRSVGYGNTGNTAGLNNPSDYSQGELFVGTYNNGPEYGIQFGSRPMALSFWYKYEPTNSNDKGFAEITVLSGSGEVIATANKSLDAVGSYTETSVNLTYNSNSAKAAIIKIIFKSTNAGDTYLNSTDIPKHTNWLNILTDYFVGSQLYIDDIELKY